MRFFRNDNTDPSLNLAIDHAMLEAIASEHEPAFTLWQNRPSVIVGFNQVVEVEVNMSYCNDNDISVVRRMSGGGAVYHDLGNLNYSFFFPRECGNVQFGDVYEILKPAFMDLGVDITLSATNDLLYDGRKFSGMAKRFENNCVMIHGTILYDVDFVTLAKALDTPAGKFNKQRGVKSRHAEVVNLRPYLNVSDIGEIGHRIRSHIATSSDEYSIPDAVMHRALSLAETKYIKLNGNI